jgi:CRISPR system Cascade subunit CasA
MSAQGLYHSLLEEHLFCVALHSEGGGLRRVKMSLPEVLATLDAAGEQLASFEALQAHQQQAWFCFLVQLGALAHTHAGIAARADQAAWREALLTLAGADAGAWCLIQEALHKPAFMQSPVPEGTLKEAGFEGNEIPTPDLLDVLLTAKNHDVKASRMRSDSVEHWIYALITAQTMEGYSGRGNYGIVRMNGGFASRPFVGLAPSLDWGARWRRDVARAMEVRDQIALDLGADASGHALLWLLPWDGSAQMALSIGACAPFFIEVCRRIRFVKTSAGVCCLKAPSDAARIALGNELKGITGDLWMPQQVEKDGTKGLTITGRGFSYDLLRKLLLREDLLPSPAQQLAEVEPGMVLLWASGMTRGQGKTEGLHQRLLLIPAKAQGRLRGDVTRLQLAQRARAQAELTGAIRSKALYAALKTLYAGGVTDQDHAISEHWTQRYEQEADAQFFEHLFEHIDADEDIESHRPWFEKMRRVARDLLMEATHAVPVPSARRWRAIAVAEQIFDSSFYRHKEFAPYMSANPDTQEVSHADE